MAIAADAPSPGRRRDLIVGSLGVVLATAFAGTAQSWPLWQPSLSARLDLNGVETQLVAVGTLVGQAIGAVYIGDLADRRGPVLVSILAAILFGIAYAGMALLLQAGASWILFTACRLISGLATVCSYFAALVAMHHAFPDSPGLSLAVPCAIFGLSPLIQTELAGRLFVTDGKLELEAMLWTSAAALFVVNLVSAAMMARLWRTRPVREKPGETEPLLPPKTIAFADYLRDPAMWALAAILLLTSGPGEMVQASLGPITSALATPETDELRVRGWNVELISLANTIARLFVGAITDRISPHHIGRVTLLGYISALLALTCCWTAARLRTTEQLPILSTMTGLTYGAIFILTPAITSIIFGRDQTARNFGLIANISMLAFTLLYGYVSDRAVRTAADVCRGQQCFATTFWASAVAAGLAAVIAFALARRTDWRNRV